jgi:transposase InsO family protein
VKRNAIWGIDTTCVTDTCLIQHHVLGMIDHGTRLNLLLHRIRRFNSWTFLGYLFLAIGNYGKPKAIKMDNHPVFRSKLVKQICTLAGIKLRFSAPGKPWQNGRIERFFGTLKNSLRNFVIQDGELLLQSIYQFQFWYNNARTHQHLAGRTPMDAWCGRDPFCNIPKVVEIHSLWHGALKGMVLRY